ncbi:Cell division protein FtsL [termite gut metagenome]|uniref:Cell division protein FtsL n=1 Tax=termite gut metagenome TaxID=433724 RepID=A0A5J4S6A3_9ZZZZ
MTHKIIIALSAIYNFIRQHRYVTVTLAFIVFITFIDEDNFVRRMSQNREIGRLKKEIEVYRKEYENDMRELHELATNPDKIEKIAREKYLMKKPNEDIYIFEKD